MRGSPFVALLVLLVAVGVGWALSRLPLIGTKGQRRSGSPMRYAMGLRASVVGASLMFAGFAFMFLRANRWPLRSALGGMSAALAVAAGIASVRALLLRIEWDASGVRRVVGPFVAQVPWNAVRSVSASKDGRSVVLNGESRALATPAMLVGFGQFAGDVLASVPRQLIEPCAYDLLSAAAGDVRKGPGTAGEK